MSAKLILATEHLRLREFQLTDADFILKLVNTPTWLKYIGDKKVRNIEDAQKYVQEKLIASYQTNGFGLWAVELKTAKTLIGMCGLVNRDGLDNVDIGFAMLPEYAGKGYGFESASATMAFAKNTLGLSKIVAITNPENAASIGLLEKLGLRLEKKLSLSSTDTVLLFSTVDNPKIVAT